ncbi:MAG: type I secretion protein [Nitrospirales bacterium]|nr:MAG: type I secretion protein [Nitrospirales bacterium]
MKSSLATQTVVSPIIEALSRRRSAFVIVGLISFVINVLMLTGPLFMLQIYDRVLTSGSVPTLVVLSGLVGGLYVFYGLLEGLRLRCLARLAAWVDDRLSANSLTSNISLSLRFGEQVQGRDSVRDLDSVRQFLSSPGPSAMFDLPWMPVYLGIIFVFHAYLGWLAAAGALIISALIGLNEMVGRKPTKQLAEFVARRSAMVGATRRNAEVLTAMGMLHALTQRWEKDNADYLRVQGVAIDHSTLFSTSIKTFRFMLQSAVLALGAWLAIRQDISPGVMIAASILTSRALAPVEQAVAHWRGFLSARQGAKNLTDSLRVGAVTTPETQLPPPTHSLDVQQLAVAAPGERTLLVQGINFHVRAGDGLGVIGPSGSGKTSLVRALVGVWAVVKGGVRLDGAEYDQWDRTILGKSIGYLPQDVELFDGTVAENIARFDPDATSESIIDAARLADLHDIITSLPRGYDTVIGEAGGRLSAGLCQRLGLARALYGHPFLIVLDEPNSNLDAQGDLALREAITTMRARGSIVIVVAHRPSAIEPLDQLVYLKDGRQGAFGPKTEVLAQVTRSAGDAGQIMETVQS